jgi:hypothetical protein
MSTLNPGTALECHSNRIKKTSKKTTMSDKFENIIEKIKNKEYLIVVTVRNLIEK